MLPAWVAPFVRSPPSSPDEVTNAPGLLASVSRSLPVSSLRPKPSLVPTITVYVPVVGAFVAICTAEAPAELVASSTPVGSKGHKAGLQSHHEGASPLLRAKKYSRGVVSDH